MVADPKLTAVKAESDWWADEGIARPIHEDTIHDFATLKTFQYIF